MLEYWPPPRHGKAEILAIGFSLISVGSPGEQDSIDCCLLYHFYHFYLNDYGPITPELITVHHTITLRLLNGH